MSRSVKKNITVSIWALIILLVAALAMAVVYRTFFISRVYALDNAGETYLESVMNQGRYPLNAKEDSLLKEMASIPLENGEDIAKIKKDLTNLDKFPDKKVEVLRVFNSINLSLIRDVERAATVFISIFVVLFSAAIIIVLLLSRSIKRHLLYHVETISDQLSEFGIFHDFKRESSSYVEAGKLSDSFNLMTKRVNLYRLVLELGKNTKTLEEFAQGFFFELKDIMAVDKLAFMEIVKDTILVRESFGKVKNFVLEKTFSEKLTKKDADVLRTKDIHVVNDVEKLMKNEPHPLVKHTFEEGMKSVLLLKLPMNGKRDVFLFLASYAKGIFKMQDIKDLQVVAEVVALLHEKNERVQNLTISVLTGFTKLVEGKDEETGEHLIRMASYSRTIAKQLAKKPNFSKIITLDFIDQIYEQSVLHDIGKVSVPDDILRKPGSLSDKEFELMKRHTIRGWEILHEVEEKSHEAFFKVGKEIARHHHERWDGRGYPDGLKGEEIPLSARIVAVADVFDALTSERPYKKAFDYDKAVSIIVEESASHFDPEVVEAFLEAQKVIKKLYENFHKFKPQRG